MPAKAQPSLRESQLAELEAHMRRVMRARNLRIARDLSWWEVLLETGNRRWWRPWFRGVGERWQYVDAEGRTRRYWRRDGAVPEKALRP